MHRFESWLSVVLVHFWKPADTTQTKTKTRDYISCRRRQMAWCAKRFCAYASLFAGLCFWKDLNCEWMKSFVMILFELFLRWLKICINLFINSFWLCSLVLPLCRCAKARARTQAQARGHYRATLLPHTSASAFCCQNSRNPPVCQWKSVRFVVVFVCSSFDLEKKSCKISQKVAPFRGHSWVDYSGIHRRTPLR